MAFDRDLLLAMNGSESLFIDNWMMMLTCGFTWIPLYIALLYIVIKNNETMTQILLIVGCSLLCVVLADGVADFIVKPLVGRWRPSNDPIIKYAVQVVDGMRGSDYGFFLLMQPTRSPLLCSSACLCVASCLVCRSSFGRLSTAIPAFILDCTIRSISCADSFGEQLLEC